MLCPLPVPVRRSGITSLMPVRQWASPRPIRIGRGLPGNQQHLYKPATVCARRVAIKPRQPCGPRHSGCFRLSCTAASLLRSPILCSLLPPMRLCCALFGPNSHYEERHFASHPFHARTARERFCLLSRTDAMTPSESTCATVPTYVLAALVGNSSHGPPLFVRACPTTRHAGSAACAATALSAKASGGNLLQSEDSMLAKTSALPAQSGPCGKGGKCPWTLESSPIPLQS